MDPERWRRLQEIFLEAAALPPGDRAAFLDAACPEDPTMRARLEAMLAHDADPTSAIARPVAEAAEAALGAAGVRAGRRIGPYEVLREIGRGGMGAVHLAARADDRYRKQVAIKVARGGALDSDLLRRFGAERRILASLDHPHIARLLDAGTTEEGLPYAVMEYVEGEPIDAWCDRRRLGVRDRLRLFRTVCSAVQFAHRNLVVHRDLKPANILVTAEGEPKLLDFGIAKLLDPDPALGPAAVTGTAMRMLTPEYASPEQVRGEPITTASDVYSLGVLLYQLLAGRLPYRLGTRTPGEIERVVCEQEPERPSAAFAPGSAGSGAEFDPQATARARSTPRDRLRKRLAGDLDTIVLTALRKQPLRRYASVEQLSEDLRRHLEGLPVVARPDTWRYRGAKFVSRHRLGVTAAAAIAVLVTGSAAGLFVQARRIARERDRALAAEAGARTEAETAGRVTDLLVGLFEVTDPSEARGRPLTAEEILDQGARRVAEGLGDSPEIRARLLDAIGKVYRNLGLYGRAAPLLEQALALRRDLHGDEHTDVTASLNELATLRYEIGEFDECARLLERAVGIERRIHPEGHSTFGTSLNNLGWIRFEAGRYDEAEALHREALAMRRRLHGAEHAEIAESLNNLAAVLYEKGNYDESGALHEEALGMRRRLLGDDHPLIGHSLNNVAVVLEARRELDRAEAYYRQVLELNLKIFGGRHGETATAQANLGRLLGRKGRFAEGAGLLRQALEIDRELHGADHPFVGYDQVNLAVVLHEAGDRAGAEALVRQAVQLYRRADPVPESYLAPALVELGSLRSDQGDQRGAEAALREGLALLERILPAGHANIARARSLLGGSLARQGRFAEAEPLIVESLPVLRERFGPDDPWTRRALARAADLYQAWGKPDLAAGYATLPAVP